jgi:hypothetical protein
MLKKKNESSKNTKTTIQRTKQRKKKNFFLVFGFPRDKGHSKDAKDHQKN